MEIILLFEGTHEDKGPKGKAVNVIASITSSVILLKGEHNILIDTGHTKFENLLLEKLAENNVKPEDIEYVINTHTHFDHTSNNHLFKNASVVRHLGIWRTDGSIEAYSKVEDIEVPGVRMIETPGHTDDSISIVAEVDGKTYVMSGDALREGLIRTRHILNKESYAHREDYVQNSKKIFEIADVIIPGHGKVIEGEELEELRSIVQSW